MMLHNNEVSVRWQQVLLCAVLAVSAAGAQGENKWNWSASGRSISDRGTAAYYADEAARPLYRPPAPVFEVTDFTNSPPILQPSRPLPSPSNNYGPINFPRPDIPRPGRPGILTQPDSPRPGRPGILTQPDSPRPGRPGILTGPVPSWEQQPGDKFAYKDYEHCKCAYGFNCASPGIKFGHCDTGKQYCCYSPKVVANGGPPPINRGPGLTDPSVNPTYGRPVLVGPGGPTGIVSEGGRPYKPSGGVYRSLLREDADEDYRQAGRPYHGYGAFNDENLPRPAYDVYARSANIEGKKNGKKL